MKTYSRTTRIVIGLFKLAIVGTILYFLFRMLYVSWSSIFWNQIRLKYGYLVFSFFLLLLHQLSARTRQS